MKYCLGKLDARPPQGLIFGNVFNADALPTPSGPFGHELLMPNGDWHMLGNNSVGNCTICDAAHQHMLWTMEGGVPKARFTTKDVESDYYAITGGPDTGCDMQVVAAYRKNVGVIDATGFRHKIQGSTSLKVGDLTQLAQATYLFGSVSVGVQLPSSAEAQFDAQEPWSVVVGDTIVGGHCITLVGVNSAGDFLAISWGKLQGVKRAWLTAYMDEGVSPYSREILNAKGISPESYDDAALLKDQGEL